MESRTKNHTRASQAVVIQADGKGEYETSLFFLFTVSQVEEVLPEIDVREMPFAPDFVQGMCCWRGLVVPVIDIEKRFGLLKSTETPSGRYLLVRAGAQDQAADRQLLRCVFRVPDRIKVRQIADNSSNIAPEKIGVDPLFVRGTYQQGDDVFVVPDVASILQK